MLFRSILDLLAFLSILSSTKFSNGFTKHALVVRRWDMRGFPLFCQFHASNFSGIEKRDTDTISDIRYEITGTE